jgi:hypothetical protein
MRKVAVILILLVAVAAGAWWLVFRPGAPLSPNHQEEAPPAVEHQHMSPDEVQRFELALNSPDCTQQASVMAPDLQTVYLAQARSMLPAGNTVRLQPDTFTTSGDAAHVDASFTAPNGASSMYTLVLIRTDANSPWLLASTEGK